MKSRFLIAVALVAGWTSSSYAAAILTAGQVSTIAAPASVQTNIGIESDDVAFFFTERVGKVLGGAVSVDITAAGVYDSVADLTPGSIAAGTTVDSYYLHVDPVGADTGLHFYEGSITFDSDILGVIVLGAQLDSSVASLGHIGTLYSALLTGLELGGPDTVILSLVGRTLSFRFAANTASDDLRIVTAAPEPTSLLLLGTGALGLLARLRRRARRP